MKKLFFYLFLVILFSACIGKVIIEKPEVDPIAVQKSYLDWSTYQKEHIMLSRNFVPLDTNNKQIAKLDFLEKLGEGNFIPIRLKTEKSIFKYQLFAIDSTSDTSIKASIVEKAFNEIANFKKEGEPFPKFSFKDLNGNLITSTNLKGKIVVIKCWYIHCMACIKEFPEVNQLVSKYKDRKDIVFISLAEDTPEQLKSFLTKKPLSYAVVPNMKEYMNLTLKLNAFPTHFIIDKEGTIVKVLSDYKSLEVALKDEIKKLEIE
jgi:peroxiredoxin